MPTLPTLWLEESASAAELIPSAFAVRTEQWHGRFPGLLIGDSGGPGKAYIQEAIQRFGLPILSAEKHDKRVAIEYMRGDILSGALKAHRVRCSSLFDEAKRVQWNEKHTGIDERCVDHETHAALYLHRHVRTHYRPELEPPDPGTYAAGLEQMRALKAERAAEIARKHRRRGIRGLA